MTLVLGIESSCDDTAVALVDDTRRILAHRTASQNTDHAPYGGVVPEIAARAHVVRLPPLVAALLKEAEISAQDLDAVAATAGPGLIGGVLVGLTYAKALAHAAGKPLLAINHLEGHALSPRLIAPQLAFPYLLLLISGGHCQLLLVRGAGSYRRLATTIDDAVGEAFDKSAKLLGLPYPGGPALEALAKAGRGDAVPLPRPLVGRGVREPHFSFAGLKSAVARAIAQADIGGGHESGHEGEHGSGAAAADIAASFQQAVIDCLIDRSRIALAAVPEATAFVVAGGVAANQAVRAALQQLAGEAGMDFIAPPPWLCTDNGAMIAWAAIERLASVGVIGYSKGYRGDSLAVAARPRWPLDDTAPPVRGAGVKA